MTTTLLLLTAKQKRCSGHKEPFPKQEKHTSRFSTVNAIPCYCVFWLDKVDYCSCETTEWRRHPDGVHLGDNKVSRSSHLSSASFLKTKAPPNTIILFSSTWLLVSAWKAKMVSQGSQQSMADTSATLIKRQRLFTVNSTGDAIVTDENTKLQAEVTQTVIWIPALPNTHSTPFPGNQSADLLQEGNQWVIPGTGDKERSSTETATHGTKETMDNRYRPEPEQYPCWLFNWFFRHMPKL